MFQTYQSFLDYLKKFRQFLARITVSDTQSVGGNSSKSLKNDRLWVPEEYLIFNVKREKFWLPGHDGYTDKAEEAGRFTNETIDQIYQGFNKGGTKEIIIPTKWVKDPDITRYIKTRLWNIKFEHLERSCWGCGYCCRLALCYFGKARYPSVRDCPELIWNGERHLCQLMLLPGEEGERYRVFLGVGKGCLSSVNPWRLEPLRDRTKSEDEIIDVSISD